MDYIEKLSSFTNVGKKGGREFLLDYYQKQENPQKRLKVIHVTGTAGKGSTSAMIANGLMKAGYKVGLFTSPHIFKLNERIRIHNEPISDLEFNKLIKKYFNEIPDASFSEYLTLIAVDYFLSQDIDYLVCEVFVGGRHDTTNIFNSVVTVITSIGLDHENYLGNTIEKISYEKLGIIRKNIPLFTRIKSKVIDDEINSVGAEYRYVTNLEETNLNGDFQKENAGLAFEVLNFLGLSEELIRKSLLNVTWKGRLEFIDDNILVDCAHNPLGMKRLSEYIKNLDVENIYYLFAISKNKDFEGYREHIFNPREIIFTKPDMFKVEDPKEYAKEGKIIDNSIEAFNYLKNKLGKKDLLVICGSIFLASEILRNY